MAVPEKQESADYSRALTQTMRQLLVTAGIGLVAGFLASLLVGGDGILRYAVTGILGALLGNYLFSALRIELPIRNPLIVQIITATVGAVIVVIVARVIA